MKTSKKNTFEVLDSYFLNTESMTMNVDYFLDCINTQIDVTYRSDKKSVNLSSLQKLLLLFGLHSLTLQTTF